MCSKAFFLRNIRVSFFAYLHSNHGDDSSFARKNFMFCVIATVVFRVINSGGVFRQSVFFKARFLTAVQIMSRFGNSNRIS